MPLTWKWSTSTGKLSTPVKKKPWILASLATKIRKGGAKVHQLTQTDEAKALKHVITSPKEVISAWLRETSKATWRAWAYLEDIWKQAEDADIPVISQAGSITRAAGTLVWGPEATRQNVLRIWDQVKKWEITVADWILEAWSSTGLQGVTLIAAPFLQAINSWLNITGLDEPLEKWIEGGTNFLTQLTADVFNLKDKDWNPSAKASSRVNSALNFLRWLSMYKWGKIINKGWAWNFVKWSTVISSPDIALSVLAFWAEEEGKELPTPEVLKGITANVATALVPAPWQFWKWTKGKTTPQKTTTPPKAQKKISLTETIKDAKDTEIPKLLKLKETPEVKKSLEAEQKLSQIKKPNFKKQKQAEVLAKYGKEKISEIQNFTTELANIQEIRKNPKEFAGIYTANELLAMKNKAIQNGIKLWMIEPSGTDKWWVSYKFTEAAHNDFNIRSKNDYLWVWVHTPIKKGPKLSEQIKPKKTEVKPTVPTTELLAKNKYDIKTLKKIGEWTDRKVYDLWDWTVLKVAKNKRGLEQNKWALHTELSDAWIIPKIKETGKDYVIMEKMPLPKELTLQDWQYLDLFKRDMLKLSKEIDAWNTSNVDAVLKKYWWEELWKWDLKDFWWGDIWPKNLSLKDGRPILIDEGTINLISTVKKFDKVEIVKDFVKKVFWKEETKAPKDDFIKELEAKTDPIIKTPERNISAEYTQAKKDWYKWTKKDFIRNEFKKLLEKDPQKTFEILDPYENARAWQKSV